MLDNSSAEAITKRLLEEVEENQWSFEDLGIESNFCKSCGATFSIGDLSKEHKNGCQLQKLITDAKAFLLGEDAQ